MTLGQLHQALKSLGYPVAYSHFLDEQKGTFITYIETSPTIMRADNKALHKILNIDIELYSKLKDTAAETKIEDLLNENEIPYEISDLLFIEEEKIFQRVFSISLI